MSTNIKKAPATGVRYSDAKKKEIVNFVSAYNNKNGRGGQSAAANKYGVTPLTISGWLKAAGIAAPNKKKTAKVAKKVTKAAKQSVKKVAKGKNSKMGIRYSPEQKQQVVDFVKSYNEVNGRGGQNQAAKKFKLSVLTVAAWLRAAGVKKPSRKKITSKAGKVTGKATKNSAMKNTGDIAAFKAALINLIKQF